MNLKIISGVLILSSLLSIYSVYFISAPSFLKDAVNSHQYQARSPYQLAMTYIGMGENNGYERINQLIRAELGVRVDIRNISWCALFVNSMLVKTGHKPSNNVYLARSFLTYGRHTGAPKIGDIVIFRDLTGKNRPWAGHVGFFMGYDSKGWVKTLGGNEDGEVKVKAYPSNYVLDYRTY